MVLAYVCQQHANKPIPLNKTHNENLMPHLMWHLLFCINTVLQLSTLFR